MPETSYEQVRDLIRDGDDALFRNGGIIGRVSDGDETHAAKCLWLRDCRGRKTVLMLAEMREGFGGRIVTLSSQVKLCPGRIDIYRPTCRRDTSEWSAQIMARMAGHDYGWGSIRLAFYKRLTLWRLLSGRKYHTAGVDLSPWEERKHCSQALIWSERAAAQGYEPFGWKALEPDWQPTMKHDRDCEPFHIPNTEHTLLYPGLTD